MGPKKKSDSSGKKSPTGKAGRSSSPIPSSSGSSSKTKNRDVPPSAGYLISCDIPTKQFIQHLNELKPVDKKFILEDLDATHLLVKKKVKDEVADILAKHFPKASKECSW